MNGLIIEDDELKLDRISTFLHSMHTNIKIECARSYKSGLRALLSQSWDIVVLDMTLPTFDISRTSDGGRPMSLGGRELLRQMKRRQSTYPTLVVTGFDTFGLLDDAVTLQQLNDQFLKEFESFYLGSVYFSSTSDDWKDRMRELSRPAFAKFGASS